MTTLTISQTAGLETYSVLRKRIRETIAQGEARMLDAVERERVRTKWEVGKLIQEHILLNKERADYGAKVLRRLSADLGISYSELKYRREFARTFPIGQTSGQLSWGQIQSLLAINEDEKREELIKRAEKENWTVNKTRSEVKKLKAAKQITLSKEPADEPLVPIKGELDTYRIVTLAPMRKDGFGENLEFSSEPQPLDKVQGRLVIDLGFSNYFCPSTNFLFRDREIVNASPAGKLTHVKEATEVDLFTYRARLLQITDGDTLWALIDLGFGLITQQHLRLRGLDAPEIIITTTKSDKYDRYLVDLFYKTAKGEYFLNNRLLEKGLAERV